MKVIANDWRAVAMRHAIALRQIVANPVPWRNIDTKVPRYHDPVEAVGPCVEIFLVSISLRLNPVVTPGVALAPPLFQTAASLGVVAETHDTDVEPTSHLYSA